MTLEPCRLTRWLAALGRLKVSLPAGLASMPTPLRRLSRSIIASGATSPRNCQPSSPPIFSGHKSPVDHRPFDEGRVPRRSVSPFPNAYKAVSAFSPIIALSEVSWAEKALARYLCDGRAAWRKHDAVTLIEDGARVPAIPIDQGNAESFLAAHLKPSLLASACLDAGIDLTLRLRKGYDHSYYFISSCGSAPKAGLRSTLTK